MIKTIIVMVLALTLLACGALMPESNDKKEGLTQYQKDQLYLTKQANKVKCQDARLDMVDAEANGDVNIIRQVKSRLQKFCLAEE